MGSCLRSCWPKSREIFTNMVKLLSVVLLVGAASALDLKALCPAYPLCDNALLAYYAKLENPQPAAPCPNFPLCDVHHVALAQRAGKKKRSLPVPGTIPGLVPGSAADAYWYQAQLSALAGRKKRSLPVPGTIAGLVPGSAAEAQWYQRSLLPLLILPLPDPSLCPAPLVLSLDLLLRPNGISNS